jgi:lipoprotein LprG
MTADARIRGATVWRTTSRDAAPALRGLGGRLRPGRAGLAAGVLLAVLALAGCSGDDPPVPTPTSASSSSSTPPPVVTGPQLRDRTAAAMAAVQTVHFTVTVEGDLPDLVISGAEGDLTAAGDASGTATIEQFGQLVEAAFVVVGDDLWIQGPTGGYVKLSGAFAGQVYDPTAILDPERGVAAAVEAMTGPRPAGPADAPTSLSGTVPQAQAASLAPGISSDVAATAQLDERDRVTDLRFELTGADGKPAAVTLTFADFDAPVTITPP